MTVRKRVIPERKFKDWSEDGLVFFSEGMGWSLDEKFNTVCLGKEQDINNLFETGEFSEELSPKQRVMLSKIMDYREELGIGIRKVDMERGSTGGTARGKQKTDGKDTPRKRLAIRSPHTKHGNLLRR